MPKRLQPIQRTGFILLGLWLLTLLLVTGYTIKLIWDEDLIYTESIRQSQSHELTLLASRINLSLREVMQRSVYSIHNLHNNISGEQIDKILKDVSALRRILFLNAHLKIVNSFPFLEDNETDVLITDRIRLEQMTKHLDPTGIHVFIETLPYENLLLVLNNMNDVNNEFPWLVLGFDLKNIITHKLQPLLDEFSRHEGGRVVLLEPKDEWPNNFIHAPISYLLPGYNLIYQPDNDFSENRSYLILPFTLSTTVLLALGLSTWSAFREVRRSHAMAELRQLFLAHISHELKTPLALVRMYAETLHLGRINEPEQIKEYYRIILREAERLSEMIQNVLTFARFGQLETIYHLHHDNLAETILRVIDEVRLNCEGQGLQLCIELDDQLPPVPHDRQGITRILWNLLDNTAKYAGAGEVTIRLYQIQKEIRLEILDKGPGIPAAERLRVLKPFERGGWEKTNVAGSGLGLALVTQVAEIHGASFSLEDRPGGGLCARISFPSTS